MASGLGRLEYWLLDVVAEFAVPVQILRPGRIEDLLNRRSLGATNAEIAQALVALRDSGLVWIRGGRIPAKTLQRILADKGARDYGLTAEGGAAWERAARPDWSRYIDDCAWIAGGGDPQRGLVESDLWQYEITCADVALLERYFGFEREFLLKPGIVVEGSVTRDVIRPWKATYWKVLPEAYRILFQTGRDERRSQPPGEPRWDHRWHDDPWEPLPGLT